MIPNLFSKEPIPEEIPKDMEDLAHDLSDAKSEDIALRKAYDVITQRFSGSRFLTIPLLWRAFLHDPMKIWHKKGFLHCHMQNYLLRILLVRSGKFEEDDIELRLTYVWFFPHQYLRVRTDENTYVDVDPWASSRGVHYGGHARGFL